MDILKHIIEETYNLTIEDLNCLTNYSEDYCNYLLLDKSGKKFVAKVITCECGSDRILFENCNRILKHLNSHCGDLTSIIVSSKSYNPYEIIDQANKKRILCILEYIEGKLLVELAPFDTNISFKLGSKLACLHKILSKFEVSEFIPVEKPLWNLERIEDALKLEYGFKDVPSYYQNLAKSIVEKFRSINFENFPYFLIHGDPNEGNILQTESDEYVFIDYQDSAFSYRIFDLAILIMSLGVYVSLEDENHFINLGRSVIFGYHSSLSLLKQEIECLPLFVALRFVQSVIIGRHTFVKTGRDITFETNRKNGWEKAANIWFDKHGKYKEAWSYSIV